MSAKPSFQAIEQAFAEQVRLKAIADAGAVLFAPARNEDADRKAVHTRPDRSQNRYGNEPSAEHERAEEIVRARLANDDDVTQALCDVFAWSVADLSHERPSRRANAQRQAELIRLLRDRDFIAFGEQLALAMIEDTIASADEIAHDEWNGDRNWFDPTARAK